MVLVHRVSIYLDRLTLHVISIASVISNTSVIMNSVLIVVAVCNPLVSVLVYRGLLLLGQFVLLHVPHCMMTCCLAPLECDRFLVVRMS